MKKNLIALAIAIVVALGGLSLYRWNVHPHPAAEADGGHAPHGESAHDGHELEGIKLTHFSDKTELFAEFPPLIRGRKSAFAAHLTRLSDFKPVDQGRLNVVLSDGGQAEEVFEIEAPSTPGIFRPVAIPAHAGERRLSIRLASADFSSTHEIGKIMVYADETAAQKAMAAKPTSDEGGISFLKEQQWKIDFATVATMRRELRAAVAATGVLKAHPEGEAMLTSSNAGTVVAAGAFPHLGQPVAKGQVLAYLLPRLGGDSDIATLEATAKKAKVVYEQAKRERERLEALFAQEAVAQKRVHAALADEQSAQADLDAAASRFGQYRGQGGGIPLRAPIAGLLTEVRVAPGAFVNDGQLLFHIADRKRLWLEIRVAENDSARIAQPVGAWFKVDGVDDGFAIEAGKNAHLIAVGGMIDPATRTVPVVYEIRNPDPRLRIGMNVKALVYTDRVRDALAIPGSAVVDENGQAIVYVMRNGESFERRPVELGVRSGDFVEIKDGLMLDERIVARGAYQVRLASLSSAAVGHGHAH